MLARLFTYQLSVIWRILKLIYQIVTVIIFWLRNWVFTSNIHIPKECFVTWIANKCAHNFWNVLTVGYIEKIFHGQSKLKAYTTVRKCDICRVIVIFVKEISFQLRQTTILNSILSWTWIWERFGDFYLSLFGKVSMEHKKQKLFQLLCN